MTTTIERYAIASHLTGVDAHREGDLDMATHAIRCRNAYVVEVARQTGETPGAVRARLLLIARSVAAEGPSKSNPCAA